MPDTEHFKQILMDRKRELYRRLHKIETDLDQPMNDDFSDRAVERNNDEVLEEIGSVGLEELEAIDAALDRIADGRFGTCAKCGKPISAERLKAIPQAALCEECIAA